MALVKLYDGVYMAEWETRADIDEAAGFLSDIEGEFYDFTWDGNEHYLSRGWTMRYYPDAYKSGYTLVDADGQGGWTVYDA